MKNFEFKSQVATTKEQSERLLALGLKKETADCALFLNGNNEFEQLSKCGNWERYADMLPAWSLHRLMLLYDKTIEFEDWNLNEAYEHIMILIEDAIRGGIFNTQFLEDKQ